MKSYHQARVTFLPDAAYLGEVDNPMTATVFFSGSAGVVNVGSDRVDRLVDATLTDKGDKVLIEGRSELLEQMGLHPDDQKVSVEIVGGKCENCG